MAYNRLTPISKYCDFSQEKVLVETKLARKASESDHGETEDTGFISVESNTRIVGNKKLPPAAVTMQPIVARPANPVPGTEVRRKPTGKWKKPGYHMKHHQSNFIKTKFSNAGAIRSEWAQVKDQPLYISHIEKNETEIACNIEDFCEYGKLLQFNPLFISKIKPKNSLKLSRNITEPSINCVAFQDNIFYQLQDHDFQDNLTYFFMTEELFTTLATNHRGNFPWNIFFLKYGNKFTLYTEKDDQTSILATINTYNENINSDFLEDEKDMVKLCLESHLATENLAAQTLDTSKPAIEKNLEPIPTFGVTEETAAQNELPLNKLYVYKKIVLDNQNVVFCRFTIDAYEDVNQEENYLLTRAVHDNGKHDWAKKWDAEHAVIKADIQKNNICKYLKWLLLAYINDIATIKLGFVTRSDLKKDDEHRIIKVENILVSELSKFYSFNPYEMFSSLNMVLSYIKDVPEDGQFVINRAPFKNVITVYKIPDVEGAQGSEGEHSDHEGAL